MTKEVIDAALMHQFKKFLAEKNKKLDKLSADELKEESKDFLNKMYPGSKQPPNQLIQLLSSPSAEKSLKTDTLVNTEDEKTCSKARKKRSGCPGSGWDINGYGDCY